MSAAMSYQKSRLRRSLVLFAVLLASAPGSALLARRAVLADGLQQLAQEDEPPIERGKRQDPRQRALDDPSQRPLDQPEEGQREIEQGGSRQDDENGDDRQRDEEDRDQD
jgi:hypothetical protein